MRVLIDTNIFIYRENDHIVPRNLQTLLVTLGAIGVRVLVHPKSTEELRRDRNAQRKDVILSKVGTYSFLESPPNPIGDEGFWARVGTSSNPQSEVDSFILYSLYRDAVRYLITEDGDLQKKSERIGLRDRVLGIDEALEIFTGMESKRALTYPPALIEMPIHNLRLNDPFFDSLRTDYNEFESWFKKVAQEGRRCLAYFEDNGLIGALLIFKPEYEPVDCSPPLPSKHRLKISTLKVEHKGYKIGELFVKLAVHHAISNDCEEIYLTHFLKDDDELVDLIREYGFEEVGRNLRGEAVFLKQLRFDRENVSSLAPLTVSHTFYPAFRDGPIVKKFLVPIRPVYHEKLFVDYKNRQTTLPEYRGQFIVEGNTIKKAYLCNSNIMTVSKGDIMLFYRSSDRQEITSLGVVERAQRLSHIEEVARVVERRTVYSINEIREMLRKPTIVFLFTWQFHLPRAVPLEEIQNMGISVPQTINRLSHRNYLEIKRRSGIDERFTFN